MSDKLKRWNGSGWIEVATINRIIVEGSGEGIINQPLYTKEWPIKPCNNVFKTFNPENNINISYSYEITI